MKVQNNVVNPLVVDLDVDSLHLDQTAPQSFTAGDVSGTGLVKVTAGQVGLDTNSYLNLDQTTPQVIINGIPELAPGTEITDSNQLATKGYADTAQGGGMKSFFFDKVASDVADMWKATTILSSRAVQEITGIAGDGETILASFITDVATVAYRVLGGARLFYVNAKTSSTVKPIQLRAYIYTTDVAGANPVLLRTSSISKELSVNTSQYIMSVIGEALNIPVTMRIKFVIVAIKTGTGGVDPTITLSVEDDTFSRLDVPSPTGVTDISGLLNRDQTVPQTTTGTFNFQVVATPQIKTDGTSPTDLTIVTGAQKTMVLNTPVYKDLICGLYAGKTGVANIPTWQNFVGNLTAYRFAIDDYLEASVEIQHDYKEGTDIEVHLHWASNGVDIDDRAVKWEVEYTIANMGTGSFASSLVLSGQTTIPLNTTTRTHFYTSMDTAIPGSGRKIGDIIIIRVRRITATGALAAPSANPFGLQVGFHYQSDTIGSRQIGIK